MKFNPIYEEKVRLSLKLFQEMKIYQQGKLRDKFLQISSSFWKRFV